MVVKSAVTKVREPAKPTFSKNAGFGGELLLERNFGHQAPMPEQYDEPRKWHPPQQMP
jgi:hypothetical protein